MTTSTSRPLLDARAAAEYLSVHPSTLARWRAEETGPDWIAYPRGGVRYEIAALDRWLADHRVAHAPAVRP